MAAGRICAGCQTHAADESTRLDGLCPACLLTQAMEVPALTILSDGYAIVNVLGDRPHATTWLARRVGPPHRPVVLKILKVGHDPTEWQARMDAHLGRYAALSDPAIVTPIDAGLDQTGQPFLVSDFVAGRTIGMECAHGHPSPRAVLLLVAALCRAVQHAHDRGLPHGHLVDDNVRFTRPDDPGSLRVMDFGVHALTSPAPHPQSDGAALIELFRLAVSARRRVSRTPETWERLNRRFVEVLDPSGTAAAAGQVAERLAVETAATE